MAESKRGLANALPYGVAAFNDLFWRYKDKASKRNIIFQLSKDEFRELTKLRCHYCNTEPNRVHRVNKRVGHIIFNGIDRKDNTQGYILQNCVPCCYRCNTMKSNLSIEEFLEHIERIYAKIRLDSSGLSLGI